MGTMKYDLAIWLQEMKNHAENCRASRAIPRQDTLSWQQILQLHIIKGSLLSWIKNLPSIISLDPSEQGGHRICIVFTSTCPGLVAAKEITQGKNLLLVSLYPEELRSFLQSFPDNDYRYHAHIWSYFLEELDSDTKRIAKCYPVNDTEKYWLHVEGIMRGQRLGRGVEHLWSWNGSQTKLLKKSFLHWAA
jgi:hypothetical protein